MPRKKTPPHPAQIDTVTGEIVLPKSMTAPIRTNSLRNIRLSMGRITRAMGRAEVEPEFARGMLWALNQIAVILRAEIETERIAKQLDTLEDLLRREPVNRDLIDVDAIRRALRGDDGDTDAA